MQKPYVTAPGVFESGDLRKSFSSGSLNKSRTLSGGGSGYKSEARRPPIGDGKYQFVGTLLPSKVVKTVIHYKKSEHIAGPVLEGMVLGMITTVKIMTKTGFLEIKQAFNLVPFTSKVVYTYGDKGKIGIGESITVINSNMR